MSNKVITGTGSSITFTGAASGIYLCAVNMNGFGLTVGSYDTTTLCNSGLVTSRATGLATVPDIVFTGHYLPSDYSSIAAGLGENNLITFDYGSEGDIKAWGFLMEWAPGEGNVTDGWQVNGIIHITNENNSYVETAPVYSA